MQPSRLLPVQVGRLHHNPENVAELRERCTARPQDPSAGTTAGQNLELS